MSWEIRRGDLSKRLRGCKLEESDVEYLIDLRFNTGGEEEPGKRTIEFLFVSAVWSQFSFSKCDGPMPSKLSRYKGKFLFGHIDTQARGLFLSLTALADLER